jgi:hypothetical protein
VDQKSFPFVWIQSRTLVMDSHQCGPFTWTTTFASNV